MAADHRGIALLIANSSYDHLDDIKNALNDASAMLRRLESSDYEIISAINFDIEDIRTEISRLKHRLAESQHREVLIYYAGHGLVHNDEHYIAGGRFNEKAQLLNNEIDLKCLSVDTDIINSICRICLPEKKTRSLVVILDACRRRTSQLDRGVRSDGRLFVPLKPRHETRIGVLLCYAYALGLGARDSGEHGLYTDCILQNIFEPGKSIVDAISIANRMATERANADQQPVMQVNYTDFFQYPLIQAEGARDNESPTLRETNELLLREIGYLRAKIQNQGELELKSQRVKGEFKIFQSANKKEKNDDMDVMKKLYKSTGGAHWNRNIDRLCWQRSNCSSEFRETNGRIAYIYLANNNLIGSIPPEFGKLSGLTFLSLSGNAFVGAIPVELGELKNLEHLDLGDNHLTGAIPKQLGNLYALNELSLQCNKLTGSIPVSFGNLTNLKKLWLNYNKLTGGFFENFC